VGKKIWVSIDETTDAEGRFIASVIIGTLLLDRAGEIFLLNLEHLQNKKIMVQYVQYLKILCIYYGLTEFVETTYYFF